MEAHFDRNSETLEFFLEKTNLETVLMKPLDVGNSTLLICVSGLSTVLLYNKKYVFKKGDILIANWDMHPVFLSVSKNFSANFCKMSEDIFYSVFRNISNSFCQFTYNYPIFKLTKNQYYQLEIWNEQLFWLYKNNKGEIQKQLIINYLQSLMMIIDNEIHKISQTLPLKVFPPLN